MLPYFDAPRMLIVDPIHNLFLGSAKHSLHVLIKGDVLLESNFNVIQQRMDCFQAPSDVGRIPRKIRSGFSSFTADQWKNLGGVISPYFVCEMYYLMRQMECWCNFVLAYRSLL